MKYFDKLAFEDFRKDLKEYMTSFYLNSLTHRELTGKEIEINPNDKLVNKDEIISLFKKNAEYKEVVDPEDGYTEKKWVVNKDFAEQCAENYDVNKRDPLLKRQEEIQEQIYQQVSYEKSQGIKLSESSAVELLEKLSLTTVHQTQSRKDLNLRILTLSDDAQEMKELWDRVSEERPYIVNKQLLGDLKYISEELPQNNKIYSAFNENLRKDFVDVFFDELSISQKIHYIGTLSTLSRGETSTFLADLIKDERMEKIDILRDQPDYLTHFVNYDAMFKNVSTYLTKNSDELEFKKIGELLSPIKTLIQIGATDLGLQKEQLQKSWEGFYEEISNFKDGKLKSLANKIEGVIDLYNFERDQKIENNDELKLAINNVKVLSGEKKEESVDHSQKELNNVVKFERKPNKPRI